LFFVFVLVVLVLGGLASLAAAACGGSRLAAALGGAAIGTAAFCRIDALLLVAAPLIVVACVAALRSSSRSVWLTFAAAACVVTAYAAAHALIFANTYTRRALAFVLDPQWRMAAAGNPELLMAGIAGAVLLLIAVGLRISPRTARPIIIGVASIAAMWVVFTGNERVAGSPFVEVVPRAVLALSLVSAAMALTTSSAERAVPLVAVLAVSFAVYLPSAREAAPMPMPLRRFVPVAFPAALLLIVHALAMLPRRTGARVAAAVVIAAIGIHALVQSRPILAAEPYAGLRTEVARVAAIIPPRALVLVDRRAPSGLGLALRYSFGIDAMVISEPRKNDAIARLVDHGLRRGQKVVVLRAAGSEEEGSFRGEEFVKFAVEPLAELALHVRLFEPGGRDLPQVADFVRQIQLFSVSLHDRPIANLPVRIDIGPLDLPGALSGFFPAEMSGTTSARWTNGEARVLVPKLAAISNAGGVVVVRAAVSRPAGVPMPALHLLFGHREIGVTATGLPAFGEYEFPVPAAVMAELARGGVLTLRSGAFVPAEVTSSDDRRRLGLMVDWVEVRQPDAR
jgi:hypothetical protein